MVIVHEPCQGRECAEEIARDRQAENAKWRARWRSGGEEIAGCQKGG
jgi:hypothetical protein